MSRKRDRDVSSSDDSNDQTTRKRKRFDAASDSSENSDHDSAPQVHPVIHEPVAEIHGLQTAEMLASSKHQNQQQSHAMQQQSVQM